MAHEEPAETIRDEVCRCVARLAGTLESEYADALRRIEVDGLSVVAFAEEQGISKSNAAVRVFRDGGRRREEERLRSLTV